jgi:hypothetical protein
MPVSCYLPPYELNIKLWNQCLKDTREKMLASGWNKNAGKFTWVSLDKAHKLFNKIYYKKK